MRRLQGGGRSQRCTSAIRVAKEERGGAERQGQSELAGQKRLRHNFEQNKKVLKFLA
jgi:hypothetical protein